LGLVHYPPVLTGPAQDAPTYYRVYLPSVLRGTRFGGGVRGEVDRAVIYPE